MVPSEDTQQTSWMYECLSRVTALFLCCLPLVRYSEALSHVPCSCDQVSSNVHIFTNVLMCFNVCLEKLWRSPPSPPSTTKPKASSALCIAAVYDISSFTPQIHFTVKFRSGLRNMLSPSLRCQARRPQSKKVRLALVLPSGLDGEHNGCCCLVFAFVFPWKAI